MAYADSDSDLDDGIDMAPWKTNLAARAEETVLANRRRKRDLMRLVYDSDLSPESIASGKDAEEEDETLEAQEEDQDFFLKVENEMPTVMIDVPDEARPVLREGALDAWNEEDRLDSIRHLFITGEADEAAEGEGAAAEDAEPTPEESEEAKAQALAAKKAALKRKFDEQYDDDEEEAEDDWYTEQKKELARQAEMNQAEFADEDESTRAQIEGYRPGTYVRVEIANIPCEFVEHFNPAYPVVVGGLLPNETTFGFLQVRIKKHRWYKRILKTNDPLIFSLGWRRFQSMPIYTLDDGTRNRMLKYTPEHMHCLASFYGPASLPNTGFCAFNTLSSDTPNFRISATGVVLNVDSGNGASHRIVKKLKLTGTPAKVYKNTAFIKDMFSSPLEVAKFEGAQLKTVSGLRGQVKKALAKPEGQFRATFEDKILMSDIVFLRAWYNIVPRTFYNPVTSLLMRGDQEREWQGMRLTGTVRKEANIKTPLRVNSTYKPVERPEVRKFNPLRVPKALQAALPFSSKPHMTKAQRKPTYLQKRAVVMEKDERDTVALLQQMQAVQKAKQQKRLAKRQERQEERNKKQAKKEEGDVQKHKERMKEIYRVQGQRAAKKAKTT